MSPLSVVIPTYNRGPKIGETIDSALGQTVTPLEIIVVDDGSTDETAAWIEAHYGERVRLLRQPNGGVARARNTGWKAASGEWIAFLDHDDLWHPDKLERLLEAATPAVGVIYCRWRDVDEAGVEKFETVPANWQPRSGRVFSWLYGWRCPIISMSVPIVRRGLLEQIGGFDPRCVPCDDWDLWLRLSRVCEFGFVNEILVDYRVHPQQQRLDLARALRAARRVLRKHPGALLRRPLLLWWIVFHAPFLASVPLYERAKTKLDAPLVWALLRAQPLALLSPQWIFLLARRLLRR